MRRKKNSLAVQEALKEENWGYFRPGYYPLEKNNVVPAIVCLGERPFYQGTHVQFVLVKTDCCLKTWQDALLISQKDYEGITQTHEKTPEGNNINEKIQLLTQGFMAKGYLPLTQINTEAQFNQLH